MRLGIIGAGRVGASFVMAFPDDIVGICCSTKAHTEEKAKQLHVTACLDQAALVQQSDIVLLTVKDDALAAVSKELAVALPDDRQEQQTCIFHCSGAMGLEVLQPLTDLGFSTGSIHPLQSFAVPAAAGLKGIYMAVDGDDRARQVAEKLIRALDSTPFTVPAEERMLYHAAAVFCSNYVVTAMAIAQKLLARWTATPQDAGKALRPLFNGTAANLNKQELAWRALTGPVSRGDVGTVSKHLSCLPQELKPPYCSFARVTAALALENHTITHEQYEHLIKVLAITEGV